MTADAEWLDLAVRCLDLTSLDGSETAEDIEALCARAVRPDVDRPEIPGVAAVVLYPRFVEIAAGRLRGSGVGVATVIGFPMPTEPLPKRLAEIHAAVDAGADEIDIVLDRDALTSGGREQAGEDVARCKEAAGPAALKVILESGELGAADRIRDAAMVAMSSGADFIKSSTGKVGTGATPEAARTMMEAVRDFHSEAGRPVGVKVSGGVRTTEQAMEYVGMVEETLGKDWLTPERFRIGASALLDDLVARRRGAGE